MIILTLYLRHKLESIGKNITIYMKLALTTLSALLFCSAASAQDTLNVLFLGNSYTQYNDLPELVKNIAHSTGKHINHASHLPGGYTFSQHINDNTVHNLIQQGNWDYIVLQEQSQNPSFPDGQVQSQVYPYAKRLVDTFRYYNPCGKILFYTTWGRKNGDPMNCTNFPPLCTYQGMDSLLTLRYTNMAQQNKTGLSPVGPLWKYIRTNHSNIELYDADESHPSQAGSYAAALSFYTALFGDNPENTSYDWVINNATAQTLRTAAKNVVYDSLNHWLRFDENVLPREITINQIDKNAKTVSLSVGINNANSIVWNMGDSTILNGNTINHTYHDSLKEHQVCVTITTDCDTNEICTTISFADSTSGVNELSKHNFYLYPNPVIDVLFINEAKHTDTYIIYDVNGRMIASGTYSNGISTAQLDKNIYYISLKNETRSIQFTFIQ
jgi:hypothetical protein